MKNSNLYLIIVIQFAILANTSTNIISWGAAFVFIIWFGIKWWKEDDKESKLAKEENKERE